MSENIELQIKECKKRRKKYMDMVKDIDVMRVAFARSIVIESANIADLKKKLKEKQNEKA